MCGRGGVSAGPPTRGLLDVHGAGGGAGVFWVGWGHSDFTLKGASGCRGEAEVGGGQAGEGEKGCGERNTGFTPAFLGWAPSRRESTLPLWPPACGRAQAVHESLRSPRVGAGDKWADSSWFDSVADFRLGQPPLPGSCGTPGLLCQRRVDPW